MTVCDSSSPSDLSLSVALSVSLGERPVARPHCSTFLMPLQSLKYDIKCHVKCCVPNTVIYIYTQTGARGMGDQFSYITT